MKASFRSRHISFTKNEKAFQGIKGKWKGEPVDINLKPMLNHILQGHTVPKVHEETMKQDVDRLVKIKVLSPIIFF